MMPGHAQCELRGGDIVIRPWQSSDVDALFEAATESFSTVGRWLPWCHENYARTDGEAWIEHCSMAWNAGGQYAFAILDEPGPRVLGGTGLNRFDPVRHTANLGYWMRTDAQGCGVATQAVRLIAAFGFECGFAQLEIVAAIDNAPSRRVADKSGARFQRIERGRIEFRGARLDAAIYLLSPPEQNAA
ncbi:MAG: GNAT family N-acetyltransferase [Rhodanobacteraceae bacterium]